MFSKILIANRGEIACRIIRTARALGYRTVAVFSDADAGALHVSLADESVRLGPPPANESYLSSAALLSAASRTGADALHPGYGFLSENAGFAQACLDANLVFIGPPASAIEAMGDKARAKTRMQAAGVPIVPGYLGPNQGDDQDDDRFAAEAEKIGYPLLVKAVAGGGGRGMRLARASTELPQALAAARREAASAFGDGRLMLERFIERGRHIEVQVFADAHGHTIHLGERDCTTQRRRQKVIEESPSPIVTPEFRQRLGQSAVAAAQAVGYRGAGTVEFIVSELPGGGLQHYFLEMNTRLQVEHPVTECVTGLDLVEWQLRVANGQPLPLDQKDVVFEGHAIEARLYAEDPYAGFTPQTGRICFWRPERATAHRGVRIDGGFREGDEIGPFYDAMVAKVIAHGRDRDDAIRRLRAALEDAPLLGICNNGRFLRDLLGHPAFRQAQLHTASLDEWNADTNEILRRPVPPALAWLAAAIRFTGRQATLRAESTRSYNLRLQCAEERKTLRVSHHGTGLTAVLDGQATEVAIEEVGADAVRFTVDGVGRRLLAVAEGASVQVVLNGAIHLFSEVSPWPSATAAVDPRRLVAPVAGVVAQALVSAGTKVVKGQQLVSVEAMKMEMWVAAGADGTVTRLHVAPGDRVQAGALMLELEITEEKP